ncbi:hypothetical protein [Nocardiopsis sp. FIRDI 009]|uniref:hypothetical protein n=1 Tax=Nocardiopsis sp. FIRDI 009 TaxID=714197 RepID=UPI000E26BB1C|nr:hypothetical protein [Nocardiopsis sp. FIRDI 009]
MSGGEAGGNPYDSMSAASKAEAMVEELVYLGLDFQNAIEEMSGAASTYVSSGLDDYSLQTVENISAVVENGIALASNVEGANISILDTDHESAEEVREGLDALDIELPRDVNN